MPQNEEEIVQFLSSHPVSVEPYFQHALSAMGHALSHLVAILVPNQVLVYGPFTENDEVFQSLLRDVRRLSPPLIADQMSVEVVHRSSLSDATAGSVQFFRDAYWSRLTAR